MEGMALVRVLPSPEEAEEMEGGRAVGLRGRAEVNSSSESHPYQLNSKEQICVMDKISYLICGCQYNA